MPRYKIRRDYCSINLSLINILIYRNGIISGITRLINKLTFLDYRRKRRRRKRAERSIKIAQKIKSKYKPEVLSGPFEGLEYESLVAAGSGLTPKLIGSYEKEIQPFIEKLIARNVQRIINIGCGEGYYAIGMALRMPDAHIYAFDIDKKPAGFAKS